MRLQKKIGQFVVFFVTLTLAMGNSTSCFQGQIAAIENHENSNHSNAYFSMDFDEIEDENSANTIFPCYCLTILEQRIAGKDYQLDTQFSFTFWQPPKIS